MTNVTPFPKPAAPKPAPAEWHIENWLQKGQINTLHGFENPAPGKAGIGATFTALDMAAAVATGTEWFGRKTTPGRVAYLDDGSQLSSQRLAALQRKYPGLNNENFFQSSFGQNLFEPPVVGTIGPMCKQLGASLIVFDPIATLSGHQHETREGAGAIIRGLNHIIETSGVGVLIVLPMHRLQDDEGVELLQLASHSVISMTEGPDQLEGQAIPGHERTKTLTLTKSEGADTQAIDFMFEVVTVGTRSNGSDVKSLTLGGQAQ